MVGYSTSDSGLARAGNPTAMSPLFLVNWHRVHVRFRALMWLVALVLAVVILVHSVPAAKSTPRPLVRPVPGQVPGAVSAQPAGTHAGATKSKH